MEAELAALARLVDRPAKPFVCAIGGAKIKDKIGFLQRLARARRRVLRRRRHGQHVARRRRRQRRHVRCATTISSRRGAFCRAIESVQRASAASDRCGRRARPRRRGRRARRSDRSRRRRNDPRHRPGDRAEHTRARSSARRRSSSTDRWASTSARRTATERAVVGEAIARATAAGAISVVGGGDAAAAAHMLGFAAKMTFVSTGGGATLEFLKARRFPESPHLSVRTILAGNWKMHKTAAETAAFLRRFPAAQSRRSRRRSRSSSRRRLPRFRSAAVRLRGTRVRLGAQTMHWELQGAFTGEISAPMLREFGVTHVILGHSERRAYCDETDHTVNLKVRTALEQGSRRSSPWARPSRSAEPANRRARRRADAWRVRRRCAQLRSPRVVIAYEPIWAIGTGENCDPAEADRVMATIRARVRRSRRLRRSSTAAA